MSASDCSPQQQQQQQQPPKMTTVPLMHVQEDVEAGGKRVGDGEDDDIENDFAYRNNVMTASKAVRLGFIRKVYGLLSMQLALTLIIASVMMFTPPIREFVHTNNWMMLVSFIGSLILLFTLFCLRRETPTNLILLAAFTVVQAYTVGVICTYYSQLVVLEALLLTLAVVGGLTLYTFQTKRDFSSWYSALFAGLCILIVGGFIQFFVQSTALEVLIAFAGAFIFSLFIVVDTQMMMHHLSAEEYILATINLYMDIINLFLYILRILQLLNNN